MTHQEGTCVHYTWDKPCPCCAALQNRVHDHQEIIAVLRDHILSLKVYNQHLEALLRKKEETDKEVIKFVSRSTRLRLEAENQPRTPAQLTEEEEDDFAEELAKKAAFS